MTDEKRGAPDPYCLTCYGRGMYYPMQGGTQVVSCPCTAGHETTWGQRSEQLHRIRQERDELLEALREREEEEGVKDEG